MPGVNTEFVSFAAGKNGNLFYRIQSTIGYVI